MKATTYCKLLKNPSNSVEKIKKSLCKLLGIALAKRRHIRDSSANQETNVRVEGLCACAMNNRKKDYRTKFILRRGFLSFWENLNYHVSSPPSII
jgi:hypothetical protein